MKPVKIVEIACEGGSITLFGWKTDKGKWRFFRETDESTLQNLMPEDDGFRMLNLLYCLFQR